MNSQNNSAQNLHSELESFDPDFGSFPFTEKALPDNVVQILKERTDELTPKDRKLLIDTLGFCPSYISDSENDSVYLVQMDKMTESQLQTLYFNMRELFGDDYIDLEMKHRDNVSKADDMLEFMKNSFIRDEKSGFHLCPKESRGVQLILSHIQEVMIERVA